MHFTRPLPLMSVSNFIEYGSSSQTLSLGKWAYRTERPHTYMVWQMPRGVIIKFRDRGRSMVMPVRAPKLVYPLNILYMFKLLV